ncbi:MAG: glycosyltransferase family 4 protein [Cytophagales bacterium]|nr:glycosyltransferase family 4 protein [Cytophagales bacterium]
MKILFLVPYPLKESPSQRFRFEQYFETLRARGFTWQVQSFFSSATWTLFYASGHSFSKGWALLSGISRRCAVLFSVPAYQIVFIHREAAPIGPPIFEWIIAKIFRKKIVYDFDDAIWLTDRKNESGWFRIIKWRSKVASICRWSYKVSAGNQYLCDFARLYNSHVVLNPTTIDTEFLHNPALFKTLPKPGRVVIGWTGSHSTLKYLTDIEPVFLALEKEYPQLEMLVIADKPPHLALHSLRFVPWSPETEIKDLLTADIGIMPLPHDEWAKGKCGFKALQYMALQIPCIASPVGVNTKIITSGKNGLLAASPAEWLAGLKMLIEQPELRQQLGAAGRNTVIAGYSVIANESTFVSLFV